MIDRDRGSSCSPRTRRARRPGTSSSTSASCRRRRSRSRTPAQLTDAGAARRELRANRGPDDAPLFLLNHWVNTDPVPRPGNAASSTRTTRCSRRARDVRAPARPSRVNLLAVDFYKRGDLFGVVDALNGL